MTPDLCCAICGVGFRNFRIGSKSRGALRRRDRQLEKRNKIRREGRSEVELSDDEFSAGEEGDDEESDQVIHVRRLEDSYEEDDPYLQPDERDDEVEEEDEIDRTAGYDPRLLGRADLRWLQDVYCLGCHRSTPDGNRKAFMIGPGRVLDHIEVHEGDDENRPDRHIFKCYDDTDFKSVIPFHESCWDVLIQKLTLACGSGNINREMLFGVMMELCRDDHAALDLPYGPEVEASQDQFWKCIPGTEVSACPSNGHNQVTKQALTVSKYCTADPLESLYLLDSILQMFHPDDKEVSNKPSRELLIQALQVRSDPFSRLPRELTTTICRHLHPIDLNSFMISSPWARLATMHNSFWKDSIYRDFPWFWEYAEHYDQGQLPNTLDYMALHRLLLDTSAGYHLNQQEVLSLANRFRIWNSCSPIVRFYLNNMRHLTEAHVCRPTIPADCLPDLALPMTAIAHPQPQKGLRTVAAIWVPHWGDMHNTPANFVIYRNAKRELIGMAVIREGEKSPFGSCNEDKMAGKKITRDAALIQQGDWIDRLLLHIPTEHRFSSADQATAVKGVTDGTIVRVGTVEALDPYYDDMFPDEDEMIPRKSRPSMAENVFTAQAVWSVEAMAINIRGTGRCCLPIWRHPSVRVLPLQDEQSDEDMMMPWQILHWSYDTDEVRAVKRISAWVHNEEVVLPDTGKKGRVARVLGMTTQYHQRYSEPARHFGMNRRAAQTKDTKFFKKLRHFDIDGRKGEYVTEVGVATKESWSAVKIQTNWGREVVFGQQGVPITDVKTAPDGHMIVGLAAQFVNQPDQKKKPGFEKWMQLSSMALLTKEMKMD
ncbi:F-box domain protein [Aspergillus clavatus NRRL 1]|uniref:F-box domain protein n=1 Tax=Aspergillus clavatus (strain ATCC 1007 / CBS 513.65 / DSM 816 / NCTC 3887 / NRRL 1 / QM 1276 / 107) TaxID=344612 RepID=A1CSD0_ASPCL|nr:F-box domain protein [Aspergillus clavatus NRRL 1]EAW08551.1 F-box domain protein [Aspergillus clavatus NRRL 1]